MTTPNPVPMDHCTYPGPTASSCPGYRAAPVSAMPDHLRYLPFVSSCSNDAGCAHLVARPTPRGGFRAGCGHPAGNPAHWSESTLVGRRAAIPTPRRVFAR